MDVSVFISRSSVVMGFAWMYQHVTPTGEIYFRIRHTCEDGNQYGWRRHNGRGYGQQEMTDSCKLENVEGQKIW